jgi:hypothetical protein
MAIYSAQLCLAFGFFPIILESEQAQAQSLIHLLESSCSNFWFFSITLEPEQSSSFDLYQLAALNGQLQLKLKLLIFF